MEIKNLNNTTIATVADGGMDHTTDLTFFGYKTKGFGAPLNANMLQLMEHFRNPNSVNMKPVKGQLWYDSDSEMLKLCTDASTKNWVNISFAAATPASSVTNHSPTGFVTISGDSKAGAILSASNNIIDADNLGAITYNWKVDGSDVGTGITYTVKRSDAGNRVSVVARYTDSLGKSESVTSSSTVLIDSPIYGDVFRTGSNGGINEFASDTRTFIIDPEVVPYDVSKSTNHGIKQIAIGSMHIAALRNDGVILLMGSDAYGQISQNTTTGMALNTVYHAFINEASNQSGWKFIAAGAHFTLAIQTDGTLWVAGEGANGQTGRNTLANSYIFNKVGSDNDWIYAAGGETHSLAIKTSGALYTTGENRFGELGLSNTIQKQQFTQVGSETNWASGACGQNYSLAIKKDGSLWAAGQNDAGQLGLGNTTDVNVFTRVGNANDWKSVSCGNKHTVAIKIDGTIWVTGRNTDGAFGNGSNTNSTSFIKVGSDTNWESADAGQGITAAVKTDGSLWMTGINNDGQLGLGDIINRTAFTQVGVEKTWVMAACSISSVAIKY